MLLPKTRNRDDDFRGKTSRSSPSTEFPLGLSGTVLSCFSSTLPATSSTLVNGVSSLAQTSLLAIPRRLDPSHLPH